MFIYVRSYIFDANLKKATQEFLAKLNNNLKINYNYKTIS